MRHIYTFLILTVVTMTAQAAFAAFTHTFEGETTGAAPANWSPIFGTTTATFTVQPDGANQVARLNDADSDNPIQAYRLGFTPETSGFVQFDIRINSLTSGEAKFSAYNAATSQEIFDMTFFRPFDSASNPVKFRSRGDNEFTEVTADFPVGSWQTIRVFFAAVPSGGPTDPRGMYSVIWNNTATTYNYNHNYAYNTQVGALLIQTAGASNLSNVDFDNIIFVPEPTASFAAVIAACAMLIRRRRLS